VTKGVKNAAVATGKAISGGLGWLKSKLWKFTQKHNVSDKPEEASN
jgi:hypothetical protein